MLHAFGREVVLCFISHVMEHMSRHGYLLLTYDVVFFWFCSFCFSHFLSQHLAIVRMYKSSEFLFYQQHPVRNSPYVAFSMNHVFSAIRFALPPFCCPGTAQQTNRVIPQGTKVTLMGLRVNSHLLSHVCHYINLSVFFSITVLIILLLQ